eukprot:m.2194 g.2194  ORF g.2194 m.2194 type:complete len:1003 (+) comp1734_c0_seq1:78-3086(+)
MEDSRRISPPSSDDEAQSRKRPKKQQKKTKKATMGGSKFVSYNDEAAEGDEFEDNRDVVEDEYDRLGEKVYRRVEENRKRRGDIVSNLESRYVQMEDEEDLDEDDEEFNVTSQRKQNHLQSHEHDDIVDGYADEDDLEEEEQISEVEQNRMPNKGDPNLWRVRCKPGTEEETAVALMRKFFIKKRSNDPLNIISVVGYKLHKVLDNKSYVYIEAKSKEDVKHAIEGIDTLSYGQWVQDFVPIDERPAVLRAKKPATQLKRGQWVRVKRDPLYANDVGKVKKVLYKGRRVVVQILLVPRIELVSPEQRNKSYRPPKKLIQENVNMKSGSDGFLLHDKYVITPGGFHLVNMPISRLKCEGVRPTLEELDFFDHPLATEEDDDEEVAVVKVTTKFVVGDRVEVCAGELKNLTGEVVAIDNEESLATIKPHTEKLDMAAIGNIDVPFTQLRKFFKTSDQVKVMSGRYEGETGLVLQVTVDFVSIMSDLSQREIKVLPEQLEHTTKVDSGRMSLGQFTLSDLVQFINSNVVACVIRIENDMLRVLDQNGNERSIRPPEVRIKRSFKPQAMDRAKNVINIGSSVRIEDGEYKGREGKVKHIHRRYVFVKSKEVLERGGIIVCLAHHLQLAGVQPMKAMITAGNMSPGQMGKNIVSGNGIQSGRRKRADPLLHKLVRVVRGPHKGKRGIVKASTHTKYRIELQATSRMLSIPKEAIKVMEAPIVTSSTRGTPAPHRSEIADSPSMYNGAQTPRHSGAETPRWSGLETPHHVSGMDTPRLSGYDTPSRSGETPWNPMIANTPHPDTPSQSEEQHREEWAVDDDMGMDNDASTPFTATAIATTPYTDPKTSTPAWTPSGMDSQDNAQTPGVAPTPGPDFPAQAYTPSDWKPSIPQEPATPMATNEVVHAYYVPGVMVLYYGEEATVKSVNGNMLEIVEKSGKESTVSASDVTPKHPEIYNCEVFVVAGNKTGRGKLININEDEAIVELYSMESMTFVKMAYVAEFNTAVEY